MDLLKGRQSELSQLAPRGAGGGERGAGRQQDERRYERGSGEQRPQQLEGRSVAAQETAAPAPAAAGAEDPAARPRRLSAEESGHARLLVRLWRVLAQARLGSRARLALAGAPRPNAPRLPHTHLQPDLLKVMRGATAQYLPHMSVYQLAYVLQAMAQINHYSVRFVEGLVGAAAVAVPRELARELELKQQQQSQHEKQQAAGDATGTAAGTAGGREQQRLSGWLHRLAWALAGLRHYDAALLDAICDAALRLSDDMQPAAQCMVLTSLAQLGHSHEPFLRRLSDWVTANARALATLNLANAAAAFACLGHYDGALYAALAAELNRRCALAPAARASAELTADKSSGIGAPSYQASRFGAGCDGGGGGAETGPAARALEEGEGAGGGREAWESPQVLSQLLKVRVACGRGLGAALG